jgi:hypothetical protein
MIGNVGQRDRPASAIAAIENVAIALGNSATADQHEQSSAAMPLDRSMTPEAAVRAWLPLRAKGAV